MHKTTAGCHFPLTCLSLFSFPVQATMPESKTTCAICDVPMAEYSDFHSAVPYTKGMCCWECNFAFVFPARMAACTGGSDTGSSGNADTKAELGFKLN